MKILLEVPDRGPGSRCSRLVAFVLPPDSRVCSLTTVEVESMKEGAAWCHRLRAAFTPENAEELERRRVAEDLR